MIETILQSLILASLSFAAGYWFPKKKLKDVVAKKQVQAPAVADAKPEQTGHGAVVKAGAPAHYGQAGKVVKATPKILRVMTQDDK